MCIRDRIWRSYPEYREECPAKFLIPVFLELFDGQIKKNDRVIDFGCGTGAFTKFLLEKKLKVYLIDISENSLDPEIFLLSLKDDVDFSKACLWNLPDSIQAAEWVLCFDVMEHISEEKVNAVLESISQRMRVGGLLSLSLIPDQFGKGGRRSSSLHSQDEQLVEKRLDQHFSIHREFSVGNDQLIVSLLRLTSPSI